MDKTNHTDPNSLNRRQALSHTLQQRVLVLDGAFGTMAATYNVDNGGCNDLLCLTHPEIVADIHRRYLDAGADIIETDSFNTNAISLADYDMAHRAYEIARAAATIARQCADDASTPDRPRFVAGSVGPTNRTLSMSADIDDPGARQVTFDQMYQAYSDQIRGLIDGGVDIVLIETVFDTLNAKAAIAATRDISPDIPLMISCTVADSAGRILSGQTIEAFCASVMHARPLAVGLNCGFGAKHMLPHLRNLAAIAPTYVSVHPNAGLPNATGGYDETPESFANDIRQFFSNGLANIIGGCCGTTPDHIRAIAPMAHQYAPRPLPTPDNVCTLSGLEPLRIIPEANFINIGERTNVAGSAKFARLIREGNYTEALAIARDQVEAGAQIIDICMDAPMIDAPQAMTRFLNLIAGEPSIARVPVMIDSSSWPVIKVGLKCVQGKCIVNSISLKEGPEVFLDHARTIMGMGAAVVVMLFDEEGQADTYQRKIDVARRAYDLLLSIGFPAHDIIIDPNILAVATGIAEHDKYALDFIRATRWIKQHLPGAKVSGGVSNLSFSFRGNNVVRKAMHSAFLYHAIAAGMDMAIVNPQMVTMYNDIEPRLLDCVEDVILYRRNDAADRLTQLAGALSDSATSPDSPSSRTPSAHEAELSPEARVTQALLRGDESHIADDTLECYRLRGNAVAVISDVLMPAMKQVGTLFGDGRLFLPQVVKSARVMKLSVAALQPYITADADADGDRPDVVIATVKGDVHDIGKNIVALVLACNGYRVHDLGVMVPAETIIDEARRTGAVAICLSGLITPSLDQMMAVVRMAADRHLDIPVVIGGATTSAAHTAICIAPLTQAPVIHSTDAANNADIINTLCSPHRDEFIARIQAEQQALRNQ